MVDENGTTGYSYDELGRVQRIEEPNGLII